jgi:hypothetical protein
LILATDMSDVRQSEGRLRAVNGVIFDIVDNSKTLHEHWKKRRDWYLSKGADIVYNSEYSTSKKPDVIRKKGKENGYRKENKDVEFRNFARFRKKKDEKEKDMSE